MSALRIVFAATLALLANFAIRPEVAYAQTTVTADWTSLGKVNMSAVSDGTTLNLGVNTLTVNTAVVTDGDSNDANFTNYYSTQMLAYYTGQIGSQTGTLIYSMDHSVFDAGDYFQTTYTLGSAVTNLRFTVANVDRYLANPYFHDAVVIEYDTGSGSWQNLRNLGGSYTLGSAVGTTTINGQAGFHGTNYSGGITSTTGNIAVNFGTTTVKRVRIRYLFGQGSPGSNPSGDYQYIGLSDFTWQQSGINTSDLSVTKSVSNTAPTIGSTVSYTVRVTNSGPQTASSVTVSDILPDGFTFVSATGTGTYNSSTGLWNVGSISSGVTRTLTITGTVAAPAGVTVTNIAYVASSSSYDPDSSPGNSLSTEDDYASAAFTVQGTRTAGTPPTLSCPRGSTLFDWDTRSWTAGSLSNSYTLGNIGTLDFTLSSSGTWVSDPTFGGQSPTLSAANTGGQATPGNSLHQYLDFADIYQTATTSIALSTAVPGLQFTVFDIDYAANDFADRLTVVGSYQGTTVYPTLTNGVVNYVIGNTAVGDGGSAETSSDGNVVVTFTQAVDAITIIYGNANTAPSDPDGQAIAIHDITFCNPYADLSVTKISSVSSDPVNGATNPKAIPGALIDYLITVSNAGISPADTDTVVITDAGPANAKICFDANGTGLPVAFTDGSPVSGLTYNYVALGNTADDLEFSSDGGTSWTYAPTADADGCDTNITHIRLTPSGKFKASTSFTLRTRYMVE
ncbi:DUF11 domain-containing protein [Parerythrobacter aestuarii]|uniref:DUF11 domain-containing protein n=1 Tax=Parerythrobacter aestuarii TaxID=3020909 RepID=UPI0024DEC2AA|nr:DUF11 domain-containing protein [Parerythrobacter aestuarii]